MNELVNLIISNIISIVISALITWFVTRHYYLKGPSKETQKVIQTTVHEIYKNVVPKHSDWVDVDLRTHIDANSKAVSLVFESPTGRLEGYVHGKGRREEYPFDTLINDKLALPVKIDYPVIQFRTIGKLPDGLTITINAVGFLK